MGGGGCGKDVGGFRKACDGVGDDECLLIVSLRHRYQRTKQIKPTCEASLGETLMRLV